MKLYTEEQVIQMLQVCEDRDLYEEILTFDDVLKTQTPIKLPTDEEIKVVSEQDDWDNLYPAEEFVRGAKWVIEQIK